MILSALIAAVLLLPGLISRAPAQVADPPVLRPGDSREVAIHADPQQRMWRLEIDRSGPVWIAFETLDAIPDLSLERWGRPERPVECDWERLGFNEYVCIRDGPGSYRLRVRIRPESRLHGRFSLRVGGDPPPRVFGDSRAAWEADFYRRVLARPGTGAMPPFEVAAIERLVDALKLLDLDEAQLAPLDRAITLYRRNGRPRDAARLLEARARVEARLGRVRLAADTCEQAVELRLAEGDDYQAVLILGWAYCLGAKRPGRLADRLRLRRALAVAQGAEAPGHALEDLAALLVEEGLCAEAVLALEAAGAAHHASADLTSSVRAVEALFALQAECGAIAAGSTRVDSVAALCFEHGRIRAGIELLCRAAEAAELAGHPRIALRMLGKATDGATGKNLPHEEAVTRRRQAELLRKEGRDAEAAVASARAAALFARAGEAREEAAERIQLGFIRRKLRRHDEALADFKRAVELAEPSGDTEQLARAWNGQGCVHHDAGDLQAAAVAYDRAFRLAAGQALDAELRRDLVRNRILINQDRGDIAAARAAAREGVSFLEKGADRIGVALTWVELGHALEGSGRPGEALQMFERARGVYRAEEDRNGEGHACNEMGNACAQAGRHANALKHYQAAYRLARDTGDRELEVWTIFNLGYTLARLGKHAPAADWFARALGHYRPRAGGSLRFARFLGYVARVFARAGRVDEGIAFAREAAEIMERRGTGSQHARARLTLGDLWWRLGRRADARAAWVAAAIAAKEADRPELVLTAISRLVAMITLP